MPDQPHSSLIPDYAGKLKRQGGLKRLSKYVVLAALIAAWLSTFWHGCSIGLERKGSDGIRNHYANIDWLRGEVRLRYYVEDQGLRINIADSRGKKFRSWWRFTDYPDLALPMSANFSSSKPAYGPFCGVTIWTSHILLKTSGPTNATKNLESNRWGLVLPYWLVLVMIVTIGAVSVRMLRYRHRRKPK